MVSFPVLSVLIVGCEYTKPSIWSAALNLRLVLNLVQWRASLPVPVRRYRIRPCTTRVLNLVLNLDTSKFSTCNVQGRGKRIVLTTLLDTKFSILNISYGLLLNLVHYRSIYY